MFPDRAIKYSVWGIVTYVKQKLGLYLVCLVAIFLATFVPAFCEDSADSSAPTPAEDMVPSQPMDTIGDLGSQLNAYKTAVHSKLETLWKPPEETNKVTLIAYVAADGKVYDQRTSSFPQSDRALKAATDAFNQAKPLPHLPRGVAAIKMTLIFFSSQAADGDIRIIGHLELTGNEVWNEYLFKVRAFINRDWHWIDGDNEVHMVLYIYPDGRTTNMTTTSAPKNSLAEAAAISAVRQAVPFPPLPLGNVPMKLILTFTSFGGTQKDNQHHITTLIQAASLIPSNYKLMKASP